MSNVPPEAHTLERFSWARITRGKTYAHNSSRVKYIREQCRIVFGENALKAVRTFKDPDGNKITTLELNAADIDGINIR